MMLEIILVWQLAKYIGNEATQKGLKKGRYQLMAVLLWFIGEVTGAVLGGVIFGNTDSVWPSYVIAIIGAILGSATAFLVMRFLPKQSPLESVNTSVIETEPVVSQSFLRSGWIPFLVVVLASLCLCFILFAVVALQA